MHTCTRNPTGQAPARGLASASPCPQGGSKERCNDTDNRSTLVGIARALRPGGLALIDIQNYTTLPELKQLVADAGLALLGIYGNDEDMRAFTGACDNDYTIIAERV